MAIQNEFGFTNTTKLDEGIKLNHLDFQQDYGVDKDNGNECVLVNVTAPGDAREVITFSGRKINRVDTSTYLDVTKPMNAKGRIYGVKVEAIRRKYDTATDTYVATEPIVCDISIRHPIGDEWDSSARIILERAFSSLYYVLNSGGASAEIKSRLAKLIAGQERPYEETTIAE
jgi:hypothetical protein